VQVKQRRIIGAKYVVFKKITRTIEATKEGDILLSLD
jgi:hypothetical protein